MADVAAFGLRLKELRAAAGLTLRELSEKAGVTPDALVKLESGRRSPTWETVLALADVLGVDCTAFAQPPTTEAAPRGPGRPRKTQEGTEEPRTAVEASEEPDKDERPAEATAGAAGKKRGRKPRK